MTLPMQLALLSWPELRHQPWRHLTALLAVMLGVALAFSVQLINDSALREFSAAVRSVNGQPDFELRAQAAGFDETLYARVAADPRVAVASPVIELETFAWPGDGGERIELRVLGIDPLQAARITPELLPQPPDEAPAESNRERRTLFDPDAAYLNAAARALLDTGADRSAPLRAQSGIATVELPVRGAVAAAGPPLAVLDIAGVQQHFGWLGRLSRIDVRLVPGADREALLRDLALPAGVRAALPGEAAQRISNVSRAYRVNLTVLALVALFTGAFLVFSVLSLSVARRLPQLALLGVLGLAARERLRLVLAESALLGIVGSVLGIGAGTALAMLALRLLAGDLGGGYFPGIAPTLHFNSGAALVYGSLGVAAALGGGWLPARIAQRIAPAQALKGHGLTDSGARRRWLAPLLIAAAAALAFAPPVGGLPLAAYASVALLLLGGIVAVPEVVGALLQRVPATRRPLALLALQRARHQRHTATIAVAGVVASLALAVALTVMVASFRTSVSAWLDSVLPADLYVRASNTATADSSWLPPGIARAAAALPGVERVETLRVTQVQLDPLRPAVALIARPLADPQRSLPLVGSTAEIDPGAVAVWVSEAVESLYGARPGSRLALPLPDGRRIEAQVAGVWRDYARQSGAIAIDAATFERLTGDDRINDLALWLRDDASVGVVQDALRRLVGESAAGSDGALQAGEALLEFSSAGKIRERSLRIFDRSFAVTYWLQAVAIGIGLFGIAASYSAQVLARRKEFGLLLHLGLTRRQVLTLVAAEGAVWSGVGALLGLLLGIAVSVILVNVVNPQSFHWTMDLVLPVPRLAALCAAVLVAGSLTALVSARAAAGREVTQSVKEDW